MQQLQFINACNDSPSTSKKNPFGFLLSILMAFSVISAIEGSPAFSWLGSFLSNSYCMCEYSNSPTIEYVHVCVNNPAASFN